MSDFFERGRGTWAGGLIVAAGVVFGSPALAEKTVKASFERPAALNMSVKAEGCDNRGGPTITLTGEVLGGGVNGKLRAQNAGGTHGAETDAVLTARLVPDLGVPFSIPKQPPEKFDGGGAGGNPYIFFEANDAGGKSLSEGPILLGRCKQGLKDVSLLFGLLSKASATVGGSCDNRGSNITIEGALSLGGVKGNIIFANNRRLRHRRDVAGSLEFVILPDGGVVSWPKQGVEDDGVTGNPLLFFQFTDPGGSGLSNEVRLGRCNKL